MKADERQWNKTKGRFVVSYESQHSDGEWLKKEACPNKTRAGAEDLAKAFRKESHIRNVTIREIKP